MAQRIITFCPICGSKAGFTVLYPERLLTGKIEFTARLGPRKTHFRIVRCNTCKIVYSNPIFSAEEIFSFYQESDFIAEPQLENMARDYVVQFQKALGFIKQRQHLLEIGCANGLFLKNASTFGFQEVYGIEPNGEAVRHAPEKIRHRILNSFFSADLFEPEFFDAICFFQVFDHIIEPNMFLRDIYKILRKGGVVLAINHNIRSFQTKFLGERSPTYDISHIFLFDPKTIKLIFEKNGFEIISVEDMYSTYNIEYCFKMFPLPDSLKWLLLKAAKKISDKSLRIHGGNMATIARKPF